MSTPRLGWVIAALGFVLTFHFAGTGCGSETPADGTPVSDGGGGTTDGPITGNPNVGNCDPTTKQCTVPSGTCGGPDAACTTNNQCCTFSCISGKCSGKQCTGDTAACTSDGECCGGKCATTCTPLSTSCKTLGNPCGADAECCGKSCKNGICSAPSFCGQTGDACGADLDCCGGLCTKAAGASLGLCNVADASGAGGCTPAGVVCGAATTGGTLPTCGGDCCSRSCRPYAPTGALICQPPSGCHPTGELCQSDTDCCGYLGAPGSTKQEGGSEQSSDVKCSKAAGAAIGRCDNGKACSPAGAICRLATNSCNATDRCCSGTVQQHPLNCKQDSLGIPRCTAESDYDCVAKGPPPPGTACATSADCCNRPCVPNPAGGGFVCGAAACVPTAGACTTTADCCAGSPCNVPAGSTKGTCGASGVGIPDSGPPPPPGGTNCSQYGQQCTSAANCCDQVPCTNGFCVFPGPN